MVVLVVTKRAIVTTEATVSVVLAQKLSLLNQLHIPHLAPLGLEA
jgi:hypothetical protein